MTASIDLDEMLAQIRSTTARTYLAEAVSAYRAGAQRAAITTAWIGVCVDLFEKISELAAQKEPAAVEEQKKIEDAIGNKNIDGLLKIEREIVEVCRTKLGIISSGEQVALSRLREDRNKCAHPSFSETGEQFNPSPELARMHLVEAMQRVLIHPPIQGKSLIAKLMTLVEQPSFPEDPAQAFAYLENKNYLGSAKPAVVRNFVAMMLKRTIAGNQELLVATGYQIGAAMNAVSRLDAGVFKEVVKSKLPQMIAAEPDAAVRRVLIFIRHNPEIWSYLDSAGKIRLAKIVEDVHVDNVAKFKVADCCDVPQIRAALLKRMATFTDVERRKILMSVIAPVLVDYAVEEFVGSSSFNRAFDNGTQILIPYAPLMTQASLSKAFAGIVVNSAAYGINQILNAGGMDDIFERFYQLTRSTQGAAQEWKTFWGNIVQKAAWFPKLEQALLADSVIP